MSNLPPGTYFGKLTDAGLASIGSKETPAMSLTFELTHVAAGGDWREITPVKRDVQLYLSEGAREYSFADLRKLGFNGDFDNPAFTDEDLKNGINLIVINEVYNNKPQDKVSIEKLKIGGNNRTPVKADVKHALAAQFKMAASASARPGTPPPAAPRAPAAAAAGASAPAPSRPAAATGTDEPPF